MKISPPVLVTLAGLCLFAFAVRICGIDYLLPMAKLGDSSFVVRQVAMLRSSEPPNYSDPAVNCYPFLLARSVALLPDGSIVKPDEALDLQQHLQRASAPWHQIRILSALFGVLLVPGTWWLARRFLGDAWALLAAAFCATSLLHADFSAQEPPHALVTTAIAFAVIAAIRLRRRGDVSSYLFAGLFAGLAIGALQSGACVLPALVTAGLFRDRHEKAASAWWILATLAIVGLFVRWLYPFHFVGDPSALSTVDRNGESIFMLSGHEVFLDQFSGRGFFNIIHTLVCYDPILLVAAIIGVAVLAVRSWPHRFAMYPSSLKNLPPTGKDLIVFLAQAVPYGLLVGMYAQSFERFVLPMLPILACAAGFGVRSALEGVTRRLSCARSTTIVLAATLPTIASIPTMRLAYVRAAPNTRDRVAEWIFQNVGPSERILVLPQMDLPVLCAETALEPGSTMLKRSDWLSYQARFRPEQRVGPRFDLLVAPGLNEAGGEMLKQDPMGYFGTYAARYVVLGLSAEPPVPLLDRAREVLRKNARLVLRVSPELADSGENVVVVTRHPDPTPATPLFERPYGLWLLDMKCMGRSIEVYQIG